EEKLRTTVAELKERFPADHAYLVADFSRPEEVEREIQGWVNGGNRAEILINNTGGPPAGPAHTATAAQFTAAFSQHLLCNHLLMLALLPGMKATGFGRIVNVTSTSVKAPLKNLGVSNT